jgi:hypothetical protein
MPSEDGSILANELLGTGLTARSRLPTQAVAMVEVRENLMEQTEDPVNPAWPGPNAMPTTACGDSNRSNRRLRASKEK